NATNPAAPLFQQTIATGGTTRVDEMAFSPTNNLILAANNAETPAFGNLFSTVNPAPHVTLVGAPPPGNQITVPLGLGGIRSGGLEQPTWNPQTTVNGGASFWISVPALAGANNPGGVAQINTAGLVLQTKNFATLPGISSGGCSPTGLATSTSGNMLVGCSNPGTQAILLDKNGNFLTLVGA